MIKLLILEIKKILRPYVVVAFVLALLASVVLSVNVYRQSTGLGRDGALKYALELEQIYMGDYDEAKKEEVYTLLTKAQSAAMGVGKNGVSVGSKTLSWGGDITALGTAYSPANHAYRLRRNVDSIVRQASFNTNWYEANYNGYELSRNQQILERFQGRIINEVRYASGFRFYIGNKLPLVLFLIILVLMYAPNITRERETRVNEIVAGAVGKQRLLRTKIATLSICTMIIFPIMRMTELLLIKLSFPLKQNWNLPLYTVEGYGETGFTGSILSYIGLQITIHILVMFCIGLAIMALSSCFRNAIYSTTVSIVLVISSFLLLPHSFVKEHIWLCRLNPLYLLWTDTHFTSFKTFNVFGTAVFEPIVLLLYCCLMILIIYVVLRWRMRVIFGR